MSAITDLVGGIVSGLGDTAVKLRTAITGKDPALEQQLEMLAQNLEAQKMNAQSQINQIEAANTNIFVSGWRPFIGWSCGVAFCLNYLIYPLLTWGLALANLTTPLPQMDIATMMPVLMGILGLGTMRSVEKSKGVASNH
jgi:hypothetical protein